MTKVCRVSLFPLILAWVSSMPVDARVVTSNSNRSYANAYQQVNSLRYQQETATTTAAAATLPVAVSDEQLSAAILDGTADGVTVSDLETCSLIYPNGTFKWDIPESGVRRNQVQQCVAVVELRDTKTKAVLATTTVAAGDTFKCNVDSFPESGLSFDLKYGKIEVPNDNAPTMEDVIAVMNEEQKQNAGLKIAAAAIIGGVAGNMLGQKQAGDTKMFGTGQTQLIDTAIGTAAGAGIMAASSYSGKVAGDTIKSTAVNAASGMILGNMLAGASGSEAVISTKKCLIKIDETTKKEKDCIPGTYYQKEANLAISDGKGTGSNSNDFFMINKSNAKELIKCTENKDNQTKGEKPFENCTQIASSRYADIKCKDSRSNTVLCKNLTESDIRNIGEYTLNSDDRTLTHKNLGTGTYIIVASAYKVSKKMPVYAVFDSALPVKPLGYKMEDWSKDGKGDKLESRNPTIYNRNNDYSVADVVSDSTGYVFEPDTIDANDGALVDISNQARAKATITGTAVGGALGGFAGYQGAQSEVSERWVAAVREYEDSLTNFVCFTGGRFLAQYNDYIEIPELKKSEE